MSTTYQRAQRMQAPRAIALCQCFYGALHFQTGDWDEAEAALKEAIDLYHEMGAASGEALARQRLGVLQTARGELDAAINSFEEGVLVAEHGTMRDHLLARLYASMTHNRLVAGDFETAEHYLVRGLEMGERHGNCATCESLLLPVAVSLHIVQGDLASAERFCTQLEGRAAEYASRIWVAMARQTRGELAAARGNLDDALSCYAEAYEAFRAAENVYESVRCRTAMANLLAARDDPRDDETAAQVRSKLTETLQQLGMDERHVLATLMIPQPE